MLKNIIAVFAAAAAMGMASAAEAACDWPTIGPVALERAAQDQPITDLMDCFEEGEGDARRAIFATMLAYSAKPYGASQSLTIGGLAADDGLDCDNYAVLASIFYRALGGETPLRMVGWYVPPSNGVSRLNHAQLFLEGPRPLVLDPTLALVGEGTFDEVASGRPVRVQDLAWRAEIESYRRRVAAALSEGVFRPSHVLYWMADDAAYRASPRFSGWGTAAAFALNTSN